MWDGIVWYGMVSRKEQVEVELAGFGAEWSSLRVGVRFIFGIEESR